MLAAKNANEKAVLDFFETLSSGDLDALAGPVLGPDPGRARRLKARG